MDASRRDTLVLVLEDRALAGLGKKLQNWLKLNGAPIRKVALKVDGQEVAEDDAEAGAQPVPPMPAATSAKPASGARDRDAELASLLQLFKRLAPNIRKALLVQKGTAKDLAQLVRACQQTLDDRDVARARLSLQRLAVRLRQVEAVERVEPQLGHAVLRVQHLSADLKDSAQCKKLAEQGTAVVDTLRQLRTARRSGDKAAIEALQTRLNDTRRDAREGLKDLLPTIARIKAGDPPADEAWVGVVALLNLESPENGAVFWSGGKDNAVDLAVERGGASLESTAGGALIDDWLEEIPWSEKEGEGPPFRKDLWSLASATYAMQARGEITVIQTPDKNIDGGGNMWKLVEQKILNKMLLQKLVSFGATVVKEKAPGDE